MTCVDEANFVRLLNCTEQLSSCVTNYATDLPIYVEKLAEILKSLNSKPMRPAAEYLHIYKTRVEQQVLLAARIKSSKPDADGQFKEAVRRWLLNTGDIRRRRPNSAFFYPTEASINVKWIDNSTDCDELLHGEDGNNNPPSQPMPRFISDAPVDITNGSTAFLENRRKLLGEEKDSGTSKVIYGVLDDEMLERDRIATSMLHLTEELRQTQLALGERVRADLCILDSSNAVAQVNSDSLAAVSRRVRDELGHKFGTCVWLLFILSLFVFFWMVLLIKFTPKGIGARS